MNGSPDKHDMIKLTSIYFSYLLFHLTANFLVFVSIPLEKEINVLFTYAIKLPLWEPAVFISFQSYGGDISYISNVRYRELVSSGNPRVWVK